MGKGAGGCDERVALTVGAGQVEEQTSELPFQVHILFKMFPKKGQPEKDDGFTIAKVRRVSDGKQFMMKGPYGPVDKSDIVKVLAGEWRKDPKFGPFFNLEATSWAEPVNEKELQSLLVKMGFKADNAQRAVADLGMDALAQFDADPASVKKYSASTAKTWEAYRAHQHAMLHLTELGFEDRLSERIWTTFGADYQATLDENPYAVMRAGVPWNVVDMVSGDLGVALDDPRRLQASLKPALGDAEGETSLDATELLQTASALTGVEWDESEYQTRLQAAVAAGDVIECESSDGAGTRYWNKQTFLNETRLIGGLDELLSREPLQRSIPIREEDAMYTNEQWGAVGNVLTAPISVLAGGPGTGKSTTLAAVLQALDDQGDTYTLLSPTARAAARMEETTGKAASTIHRRLGMQGMRPVKNIDDEVDEDDLLTDDVIIVDESSMVDSSMMERIISHMSPHSRLMLVGDPYQLPPVGAGSPLLDIIKEDRTALTHLNKPFRQAQGSLLVLNAHRIKEGQEPYWNAKEAEAALAGEGIEDAKVVDDWSFQETSSNEEATAATTAGVKRLAKELDIDIQDIFLAAPSRKGSLGVWNLNKQLQAERNPKGEHVREGDEPLRLGDRVMNTQNRYARGGGDLLVSNGDLGYLEDADEHGWLQVRYDNGETLEYQPYQNEQVSPAYASTVHKLQGSEAPAIVTPLVGQSRMLSRNLLYTAFTRAKQQCLVIGDKDTLRQALTVDGTYRSSALRLREDTLGKHLAKRLALLTK